ncbi:uncharacterized protein LOC118478158 [Aplysia californica]|uniref:Uncharacterized protein LOC118478158 n=1 Tax=Aplysia californica TaxID=6500 RepID=A0ABM1VXA3_APLCA|nr:uncharacterized protein LOC118478158 [Aplysia californica]
MGRNCTAYMTALKKINDGSVTVEYCLQHTGHDFKLGHLKISAETRAHIAGKLNQGVEPNKLLYNLRESMTVINRDSLIRPQDLHNIHRQFNISRTEKHRDDKTSVDLWVEELSKEDNNPIIFFKQQTNEHKFLNIEDYLLGIQTKFQQQMMKKHASKIILMDSTHGTTQYDFYLTTILVLDDYRQSMPVAWAISNREDSNILKIFMEAVLINCDQSFETEFFMSDLANNFYNAWCQVFPKPKKRLYCDWHLDKAWRQKAQEIIKDHEFAEKIYQHIKALQQLRDESEFRKSLQGFLAYIKPRCPTFHTYFDNTYVSEGKISQWAHCFRIDSPTNTNMHAESFHRVLKTNYFNRKQNRRVDNLLAVLLKIAKDKATAQLITKEMGTVSSHMIEIRKRHREGENITGIKRNAEEDDEIIEWRVPSSSVPNQMYNVTQNSDRPCGCKLICDLCSVCVHMYHCTCEDFQRKNIICKHIHAVHMAFNRDKQQTPKVEQQHDEQETVDHLEFYKEVLCENKPESSNNVDKLVSTGMSIASDLIDLLQDAKKDNDINTLQTIVQRLRDAYQIGCGTRHLVLGKTFTKKKTFSSNKKFETQRRFFSTKRKSRKISKLSLKKPDSLLKVKLHDELSKISPDVCAKCWEHDDKTESEDVNWFECAECNCWIHVACDGDCEDGEGETSCSLCRANRST